MNEGTNNGLIDSLRRMSREPLWVAVGAVLLVGAIFAVVSHRAHVAQFAPYLLLLACPLMHVFMHGRHGGHGQHGSDEAAETRQGCHKPEERDEQR